MKALLEMRPILKTLAASTEELKVAKLSVLNVLPHVGMVVGWPGEKCELALVPVGATDKFEFGSSGLGTA